MTVIELFPSATSMPLRPMELRRLRMTLGLSKSGVASCLHMNAGYYGRIENGKMWAGVATAKRIADFFQVDLEDLIDHDAMNGADDDTDDDGNGNVVDMETYRIMMEIRDDFTREWPQIRRQA